MFDLAYFVGLGVSELVGLTWGQVIRRDSGDAQLSIVGQGSKDREVLIPAVTSGRLFASRDAPAKHRASGSLTTSCGSRPPSRVSGQSFDAPGG